MQAASRSSRNLPEPALTKQEKLLCLDSPSPPANALSLPSSISPAVRCALACAQGTAPRGVRLMTASHGKAYSARVMLESLRERLKRTGSNSFLHATQNQSNATKMNVNEGERGPSSWRMTENTVKLLLKWCKWLFFQVFWSNTVHFDKNVHQQSLMAISNYFTLLQIGGIICMNS